MTPARVLWYPGRLQDLPPEYKTGAVKMIQRAMRTDQGRALLRLSIRYPVLVLIFLAIVLGYSPPADSQKRFSKAERIAFQGSIRDRRYKLHRKFKKVPRKKTRYIIVHTSEAGLRSTLNVVSTGKVMRRGYRTYGGHTHYVIARNGHTYRILDRKYRADHAGRSMWDNATNLSNVSVSIELVGYHYTPITKQQYRSVGILIDMLRSVYSLDDRAVLTHSQIAYGKPNRWVKHNHRGRKKCAKNFDRPKARLGPTWSYDPDVKAGRLTPDVQLAKIYYRPQVDVAGRIGTNIISASNTAWSIAGEDFDDATTLYRLPNGKSIPGDEIDKRMGWNRIPAKTVVLLNQSENPDTGFNVGPIKVISRDVTAWSFAGSAYRSASTFYFFPDGRVRNGRQVSDWDDIPTGTRMIIGYRQPQAITPARLPVRIAGKRYKDKSTLYYFPGQSLVAGNQIKDFTDLSAGVLVFVPRHPQTVTPG
jgi:N-acetylmuramoyl-L-alanine amidase